MHKELRNTKETRLSKGKTNIQYQAVPEGKQRNTRPRPSWTNESKISEPWIKRKKPGRPTNTRHEMYKKID